MPEHDRYLVRTAAGLCASCGTRLALRGITRCRECADQISAANAERALRLQRSGLCAKCGAERRARGRSYCTGCLRYFADRAATRAL